MVGKSLNDKGQGFFLFLRNRHYHLLELLRFSDQQGELIWRVV